MILWISVFLISLFILVKGADWLLAAAEKIGLSMGLSPFIVGVVIVGFGTSFPELVSSFVAMAQGVSEIVSANAIGSNIVNILLVTGIVAIVARRLTVTKDLIDLDLPLFALATSIFLMVIWDGEIVVFESVFLVITYCIYLGFSLLYREGSTKEKVSKPKVTVNDYLMLVIGILGLTIGAKYMVDSIINLSEIWGIAAGVITITAVAIGTSLPELTVSIKAALRRQSEVALGNIFGSNIFNLLVVPGLPGLFGVIVLDEKTFDVGVPILIMATILFVISGISRRIHVQEGALYIVLYLLFVAKMFGLF